MIDIRLEETKYIRYFDRKKTEKSIFVRRVVAKGKIKISKSTEPIREPYYQQVTWAFLVKLEMKL